MVHRLILYLSYYEQCCGRHGSANLPLMYSFHIVCRAILLVVGLLDLVVLFLIFLGNSIMFSMMAVLIYIHPNSIIKVLFLPHLLHLSSSLFLITFILTDVRYVTDWAGRGSPNSCRCLTMWVAAGLWWTLDLIMVTERWAKWEASRSLEPGLQNVVLSRRLFKPSSA